jgi:excisionase family DNA binding protein
MASIETTSNASVVPSTRIDLTASPDTSAGSDLPDALLTPAEVARLFRVNPKTVTRWARAGKLTAIRTLGGHRRFRASEIQRCLEDVSVES